MGMLRYLTPLSGLLCWRAWFLVCQQWGRAVLSRWLPWVGLLSTRAWFVPFFITSLQPVIDRYLGHRDDTPLLIFGLVALLYASFLAWNDSQEEIKSVHEKYAPRLEGWIKQWSLAPPEHGQPHQALVKVNLVIRNLGAD